MKRVFVFTLVLLAIHWSNCAKILGVFPVPARSHYILGSALMKGLAEKGHDVTIIAPYVEKTPPKHGSYKQIELTGFLEEHEKRRKKMNLLGHGDSNLFLRLPFVVNLMYDMCEQTLNHPNVRDFLKSEETFDVVIVEQFLNDAQKGFASHFKAPMIVFSTIGANNWINLLLGNPSPPSYVPDALLGYSSQMTFCERTVNMLMQIYAYGVYHLFGFPKHEILYNQHFPNGPSFYDTLYNASIVLLNSHPSMNQPVPYVPKMVDIGGFHVQPAKTLPADLKKFLDDAKEGVIYFSMGSNVRSSEFPPEKRDAILNTFAKLKYKILWKWEEDVLPGQPQNVKLGKWLPQQEILAHPNIKLFITHGGLLSTTETIYHGVPVLAIPIAADQRLNAKSIVNEGFGLMLGYRELSEQLLTEKLNQLLSDPKYYQNAKKRSKIFHDRLVKPMDTAVYWVEYVIRHGGAPHLKVAGVDLPYYKYLLLDVIAFLVIATSVAFYLFCKTVKMICSRCLRSKNKKLKRS